jgi:hypothetical protein
MEGINWLSIVVGALVPMVAGFIWYHPKVMGTAWMNSLGFKEEDLQGGNMALMFGVSYLMAALLAYQISVYVGYHDPVWHTFKHGAYHAVKMGFFIAIPVLVTNSLFQKNSWINIGINVVYWIITLGLMGGVIALFF